MGKKKNINIILNSIYIIVAVIFILDLFTNFQIKNETIKLFVYYGIILLTAQILIWNYIISKSKFLSMSFPIIMLILIFMIGPIKIFFLTSTWKTQKIIYENAKLNFIKVEYQIQDIGARGYNQRTVKVINIFSLFIIVSEIPKDIETKKEWVKVNIQINEQDIKFP